MEVGCVAGSSTALLLRVAVTVDLPVQGSKCQNDEQLWFLLRSSWCALGKVLLIWVHAPTGLVLEMPFVVKSW